MVITLLGKDLGSYLKIFKTFSVKTVVMLAEQLLATLESVHQSSIIHRDIKPENIAMGRNEQSDICYLIDFGISKYYKDSRGRHIPLKDKKSFIGTTRYASISAHQGVELSRKDDLESLGYVLIFLLKGALPWQNLNVSDKEKTKRVGEMKAKIEAEELCKDLPVEFANYMTYVKSLVFTENPDYNYLKGLMRQVAAQKKILFDNIWDWSTGISKKSNNNGNIKPSSNSGLGSFLEEKNLLSVNNGQKGMKQGSNQNLLAPEIENTYNSRSMISQCGSIRVDKGCDDFDNCDFNCNQFLNNQRIIVSTEECKEFTTYQIKNIDYMMRQLEAKKVKAQFKSFKRNAFADKS